MPRRQRTTTQRGYGAEHQRLKEQWRPYVDAGETYCHAVVCFMPSRWIQPGTPWDLGHNLERTAWTGPEHRYCNRKEPQLRQPGTTRKARTQQRWIV